MSKIEVIKEWIRGGKESFYKRIICFEGPDGTGKTSQANYLQTVFNMNNTFAEAVRQPDRYRYTIFQENISDEERIPLLLADYEISMAESIASDFDFIILDRIPIISLYVYNMPNIVVNDVTRAAIEDMIDRHKLFVRMPDIIFVFNKMSFRRADNTVFEKNNTVYQIYDRYQSLEPENLMSQYVRVYDHIPKESPPEDVYDFIIETLYNRAVGEGY